MSHFGLRCDGTEAGHRGNAAGKDIVRHRIVLVTHNIGVIKAMADTMLVMKDGEMWEYGSVPSVLKNPQTDYTKKLLAAVPRLRR